MLAALLVSGCGEKTPEDFVAEAKSLAAKGETNASAIEIRSGLQKHPNSPLLRIQFAQLLLSVGEPVAAQIELEKLPKQDRAQPQVILLLAKAAIRQGQHKKVIEEFAQTTLADPVDSSAIKAIVAAAYGSTKQSELALKYAAEALSLNPKSVDARLVQARLTAPSDPQRALALLDEAIALDANNADAWQLKGDLLVAKGEARSPGTEAAYRNAVRLQPLSVQSHAALVGLGFTKENLDVARADLTAMQKALPGHPQMQFMRAQLAFLEGKLDAAAEAVLPVLKLADNSVDVLTFAGAVEIKRGKLINAETHLAKAVALAPNQLKPRVLLATVFNQSGQPHRAIEALQPLQKSPELENSEDANAVLAQAYLQQGDHAKAEVFFKRALEKTPGNAELKVKLALNDLGRGQQQQAFGTLASLAESRDDTVADLALINALLIKQDTTPALAAAIDRLARKANGKTLAALFTGQAKLLTGDLAAARKAYDSAVQIDAKFTQAHLQLAALDVREGHLDAAKSRFNQVLAYDPKNVRAKVGLAEVAAISGQRYDEVVKLFQAAVAADPTEVSTRKLLIHYQLKQYRFSDALTSAQTATAAITGNPELLDSLSQAQLLAGQTNQALSTLQSLVSQRSTSAEAFMKLANAQVVAGDKGSAERSFRRAAELEPRNLEARLALVAFYIRTTQFPRALDETRRIQKAIPDDALPYAMEGDILLARGDSEGALKAYAIGVSKVRAGTLPQRYHTRLLQAKRDAEAAAFSEKWAAQHPEDVEFLEYMGARAAELGDWKQAERLLRQASGKVGPRQPTVLNNLAWALLQQQSPDALQFAERAFKVAGSRPEISDTYLQVLIGQGKKTEAIQIAEQNSKRYPDNLAHQLNLAKTFTKAGQPDDARRIVDELRSMDKYSKDTALIDAFGKTIK